MSDIKFSCPLCAQHIACESQWENQIIQCPICQGSVTVPPKPRPVAHVSVHAKGHGAHAHHAPHYAHAQAETKRKSIPVPLLILLAAAVPVAGYYGWSSWKSDSTTATISARMPVSPHLESASTAETPPPAQREPPLRVIPIWTLDLEGAKIPSGTATGRVAGASFTLKAAALDISGPLHVLSLRQNSNAFTDHEIAVYLRLDPGENLAGRSWTIAKDARAGVPQVVKRWKVSGRAALQQKTFTSGYALKLELGSTNSEAISGKIFLAMPDAEQSFVAGEFSAPMRVAALAPVSAASPQPPIMPMGRR